MDNTGQTGLQKDKKRGKPILFTLLPSFKIMSLGTPNKKQNPKVFI